VVDHSYNWHDAIHNNGGPCGADSPEPCDAESHGTQTMGTSVGNDGGANQIGVAPGAEWIGCRCWEPVRRTYLTYVAECFEWFVAPTDLNGENPDPSKAPHVINNSWICEFAEGCPDGDELLQIVETVRAAGIVVVASAGNSGGRGCESVSDPPAIYEAAFTVGSTDEQDELSFFSSRGPVSRDGSGRIKPDIVAPGQGVRSSIPGGGYESGLSGTSLAGPIVAGTVALMISAVPSLAGDVDAIEQILIDSALPLQPQQPLEDCGGLANDVLPNNNFGWGRVDAWAAVQLARARETGISDPVEDNEDTSSDPVQRFRLHPNRPNPFNPATRLRYDVPHRTRVALHVYDAAGRRVCTLVPPTVQPPGRYDVDWDGRDSSGRRVASGVYFARLEADGRVLARRPLTLVR
jgi:subtilisin family serine protease